MHIPVLQNEVLKYFNPRPDQNFIDCTFGEGGHAWAILEKVLPKGRVLGIDYSSDLIEKFQKEFAETEIVKNLFLVCDNFKNLKKIVQKNNFNSASGVLYDLGTASWHLEESEKGFSFMREEPLDMRCEAETELSAERIVNEFSEENLEKILREYGEEKFAERIAREIIKARKINRIESTFQLVDIIKKATPLWYHHRRIHPATKTFQALRIAVNDELENLKKSLPQAVEMLQSGGRLIVISFHSLEDRIVKNFFKQKTKENLIKIITKKPIIPTDLEMKINPRSRSAKLRVAEKI